jgi:hypothetical protein
MFRCVWGYLCGVREEKDPEDRVVDDPTDIVPVPAGDRSDRLLGVDLFRREVQCRAAGNAEADNTRDRIKCYHDITQPPRNGILRFARGCEFGRGEDRDRTERESGDCCDCTNVGDLGEMDVGNNIIEGRKGDNDQVQRGERVQGGSDCVPGFEGRDRPPERGRLDDEDSDEVEEENELDETDLGSRNEMKSRVYG